MSTPNRHATAYERHAPDPRVVERALAHTRTGVFWMHEAGPATAWPRLEQPVEADLVIVGAGYLGLWTAVLAKRRNPAQRVVVLESHRVGWAASGRNGGFCEASLTHGEQNGRSRWPEEYPHLEKLGLQNLEAFERDVHELGLDCHWERPGVLSVAVEEHQLAWLGADALGAAEVRAQVDSPLFLGGSFDPEVALVQPVRLVRELARVAAALGVEIFEHSAVTGISTPRSGRGGRTTVRTRRASVSTDRVVLATNAFRSLLRRNRAMTVPVYDYVLMTEPLSAAQLASVGWAGRQGVADLANQFHYIRLSRDNRILFGGYDAVYHRGRQVSEEHENRPASHRRLAEHFFAMFPQLEGLAFSHQWAGAIDTSTQFTAFYGLARQGRVAFAAGFTGLGVGATRFAAEVLLDLLAGETTERTSLEMVRRRPLPFPPEPALSAGIQLTRWSLDRADHEQGRRNAFLRVLDRAGLGFDS